MKTLLIILWGSIMLAANNSFATEFKVKVNNVDIERGGQIIVMVFGEEGFPKDHDKAVFYEARDILQPVMEFSFETTMKELAVKVLHDENKNGKVTKNWTGIYPKEGLGFSNEQKVELTGAPKYKYSKLSKEQFRHGLEISILYP